MQDDKEREYMGDDKEIVYCLTNPAMPRLVKIGKTNRADISQRMIELYSTGVALPFELIAAVRVDKEKNIEEVLHTTFSPHRVNPKREFFEIEPYQIKKLLLALGEDITNEVIEEDEKGDTDIGQKETITPQEKQAGKQFFNKRQNFDFQEMGIPIGAKLIFKDREQEAEVIDNKRVRFRGEEMSLSQATRLALNIDRKSYAAPPRYYWYYQNRLFHDIYNETYPLD